MASSATAWSGGLAGAGGSDPGPAAGGPVVVGANWYRFRAGEHIHHDRVAGVSFIWVIQGTGVIRALGETFTMTGNSILRLPWNHDVDYRADAHSPFHIGTLHMVPWHAAAVAVEPRVAFVPGDPLFDAAWRRGHGPPERPVMRSSRSVTGRNLVALASYCVERFLSAPFGEASLRAVGMLIEEEGSAWSATEPVTHGRPVVLELMIDFVLANLGRHLSVAEVAEAGDCSQSTAERLFARYTGRSVLSWVRDRRMQEAARLLRTSGLRVSEVARRVGYADPLYFSRVFTAEHAVPPSRYAQGQLRP